MVWLRENRSSSLWTKLTELEQSALGSNVLGRLMQAENLKDAEKSHADTLNLNQGEIDRLRAENVSLFALNAKPPGQITMISVQLFAEP
jgi:hypothetical protein